MYSNHSANLQSRLDYRWIALASVLLSLWLIYLDPLVNRDAIIYLRAADAYLLEGFTASQQLFGRPLISICMAWIHQLTGLPLHYAGLAMMTAFYTLLSCAFVATVHTLGGDRRVQIIAAIVILSHPMVNSDRSAIMRDAAYLSLLMLAFRELLLYLRNPVIKHQLRWFVLVILASLFRFEGLFFMVLAPLGLLFTRQLPDKGRHCLHLLIPQLLVVAVSVLGITLYMSNLGPGERLFPAIEYYVSQLTSFGDQFRMLTTRVAGPLLEFTSKEDASLAVITGLLSVLAINMIRATTWVWAITLLWGWRNGLLDKFRSDDKTLLATHLLITSSYLTLFTLINRFMLERYCLQAAIFLLLLLPFVLSPLWQAGGWRKVLVIILLLGLSADTLHNSRGDKAFIPEATEWVLANTPHGSRIVTNEKYIAYFSEREVDWASLMHIKFQTGDILNDPDLWRDADYIVMHVRAKWRDTWFLWLEKNGLEEMRAFPGENGGMVSVVALGDGHPAGVD